MKKKYLVISILGTFIIGSILGINIYNKNRSKLELENEKKLIELITSKYNNYVITNKDSNIYEMKNGKYVKAGSIYNNVELELDKLPKVTKKTKYFKLKNINYYINYKNIKKIDKLKYQDINYKSYLLFNENIFTKKLKLYKNDNIIYEIHGEFSLPIIIKENNKFFIEYDNKLLYVLKEEIEDIIPSTNNNKEEALSVAVIAYHFIYDPTIDKACNQIICHTVNQFESHLKYLKENNILTLRAYELDMFFDKKIKLPKETIMITIDDGWASYRATPLLEKYQKYGTYFIVTSWNKKEEFKSNYVEVHSHSHDLHVPNKCPGGQGGGIKCLEKNKLLLDLKTTREKLDNSTIFCYPFYEYNNYAINALKEAGFTMAFAGGNIKANQNINKFIIPRITFLNETSVDDLKEIIQN